MLDEQDKQWLAAIFARCAGLSDLRDVEKRLEDHLERVETTLLRFIRTNELRVRAGEAVVVSIQQRLDDLTDRVAKLEK